MAVDIKFYKSDLTLISTDKVTGGLDMGTIKKNQQQVVPVVIKNEGTNDATNIYVVGSQLHDSSEISASDFTNETYASKWKSFSMLPDGDFLPILPLPSIKAGKTMVGVKKYTELFTNPASSLWKNDTLPNHSFNWTGSSVKITDTSGTGKIYARMDAEGWGNNKEIDVTFQLDSPASTANGGAFVMFCLRQNSAGDEKGYLINLKRTATAINSGTVNFEIRKGAGIKVNGTNDFGTVLASTVLTTAWKDYIDVRIKLFTNSNSLPELKIWVGSVKDTDAPIQWGTVPGVFSWVDTLNTYPNAGKVTLIVGSGGTNIVGANEYDIRSAILTTEDPVGKVYIKTVVGEGAVDALSFNSAMELFYDQV